nr:MAG TPA: minor tail protein [Caudoviricetes sp.]
METWYPYFLLFRGDIMADKQQLVYEINVVANGTDKIEGVKKSLEGAKDFVDKLNNTNVNIGVNDNFKSNLHTISQDLREVKRGIELLNKGATINISGIPQTEQSLRALEKTLEDAISRIKATSFNNVAKDMAKLDEAAAKDSAAIDKLIKKYEQLTRSLSIAKSDNKLIPESTWYNRRNSLDEVIAKLREYGIVRDNVYRGDNYASYRNSTQAAINDLKRRAELETQIERIIDRQTLAMERGQQVKRADFELSVKQLNQLLAEYQKLGGTKTFTSPFSSFANSEAQNKAVMQKNLEAWSTGLRTYSQELSRLMALQEQMYIIWRHDGSQEARQNLDKLATTIAKVRAGQEAYQRTVNTTKNPVPTTPPAQPVDPTGKWAEGIQSYTRELRRLEDVQQRLYALWKTDPSNANKVALDNVKASLVSVRKEYEAFQKDMNNTGTSIKKTTGTFTSFEQKLRSHLYWITAGSLLGAAFTVPTETFNSLVQLDEEMHNLATVMPQLEGKSTEAIAKYQEEQRALINTASEYGESVKDVMESARLWGRMYKDQATVNTLVSQSAKLAVADNFSMAESTKAVEAAMFQYGMVAKNSAEALAYSNKIVDVYTKLSHNAGVSAQDLAAGVERSGSVAKQAGISFEFLNALIAQGTRATALSGSEIGNMLKTMLASFNSDKAVKELNKLGIATTEVVNGTKRVRSAQAVLMDVAVAAQGTNKDLKDLWIQMSGGRPKLAA